ncbi:MAG: chemotaxis protein CheA, partial [Candidatus Contubernalis sp.]|nr:chemotaxis protein CheA [Candidatus Contubernalis sp.]
MSLSEYKDVFISKAREHIQTINEGLLALEGPSRDLTEVESMFSAAHSLKGMAGTLGYDQAASLTHGMEEIFDALRHKKIKIEKRVVNLLFESVDVLENLLDQVVEGQEEEDVASLTERLKHILEAEAGIAKKPGDIGKPQELFPAARGRGEQYYLVTVTISKECLLKSVRAYMVLKEIKNLGSIVKALPAEPDLEAGIFGESFQIILQTRAKPELIKGSIENIPEIQGVVVEAYEADPEPKKKKSSLLEQQQKALLKKTSEKVLRVETEKLDLLIGLVGELVINRTRVVELSKNLKDPELKHSLEQLDVITSNLQNAIMKLRMVSVKQIFERFPRLVRDFSESENKKVNLVIQGEETELERSIVNVITEPLMHMVKNALDHGVERAADRKRLGKPQTATLKLSARNIGSHVVIEVEDDGSGIDPRKIKIKAIEKGIKSSEELDKMTDEQVTALIFHSGLSNDRKVLKGSMPRPGLDVVKSTLEALKGEIQLKSTVGKGTRFIIKLPLTLAIIKAMMVSVGKEIYAIPLENIKENIHVSPGELKKMEHKKTISLREEVLPLLDLGKKMGLPVEEFASLYEKDAIPVVV